MVKCGETSNSPVRLVYVISYYFSLGGKLKGMKNATYGTYTRTFDISSDVNSIRYLPIISKLLAVA